MNDNESDCGQYLQKKRRRKSQTANWLTSLPLCLTYVTMSKVEERMLKEKVHFALGLASAGDAEEEPPEQPSAKENKPDAA